MSIPTQMGLVGRRGNISRADPNLAQQGWVPQTDGTATPICPRWAVRTGGVRRSEGYVSPTPWVYWHPLRV